MKWTILGWLVALLLGAAFTLAALMSRSNAVQGGTLPAQGEWTLTLNATSLATCLNRRSFQLPAARIFQPTAYTGTLTLSGDAFEFRGDVFARVPGTNRFNGTITLADGIRAPIQFNLVTPRHMTGQIVTGYRVDTTRCSQSTTFTIDRAA